MEDITPLVDDLFGMMKDRGASALLGACVMEIALIVTLLKAGIDKDVAIRTFATHWDAPSLTRRRSTMPRPKDPRVEDLRASRIRARTHPCVDLWHRPEHRGRPTFEPPRSLTTKKPPACR